MTKLNHPNIIKLHCSFEDDQNIYLILELASKDQLFKKMMQRQLSDSEIEKYFYQTLLPTRKDTVRADMY